jgi:hypothetical protein
VCCPELPIDGVVVAKRVLFKEKEQLDLTRSVEFTKRLSSKFKIFAAAKLEFLFKDSTRRISDIPG